MIRPMLLPLVLLASTALAEAQRPRVAVHPLVLEGVDSKKDREELTALLPGIVIAHGRVEIASPSDVDAELKKKGQAFCSADNLFKCLAYIAEHTSSVHTLRVELRRGGRAGEWELLANVVRVDGVVELQTDVVKFTQPDAVKLVPIARPKLEEFIASLKLSALPLAPPAKPVTSDPVAPPVAVAPTPDTPKTDIPVVTQPKLPRRPENTPPRRFASFLLSGVTVVALGFTAGLAISAKLDADFLATRVNDKGSLSPNLLGVARDVDIKNNGAVTALVVGVLAASTAVTMYVLSSDPDKPTTLSAAPIPGGAAVSLSSRF
jgi:hypothetical protein